MLHGEITLRRLLQPIQHFLDTPGVTEVVCNKPGEIGVERGGQWSWHDIEGMTFDRLDAIGILTGQILAKDFDGENPICLATLPDGQRFTSSRPPISPQGNLSMTIRVPSQTTRTTDDEDFTTLMGQTNIGVSRHAQADQRLGSLFHAKDWKQFFPLAVQSGKNIIATGTTGSGKAQPLDAKVLTPTGWRLMGELAVGDLVTCPDGRSAPIIGIFPQGEKEIYRVGFEDGRSVECCEEHLWKIWEQKSIWETGKSHGTRKLLSHSGWSIRSLKFIEQRLLHGGRYAANLAVPLVEDCIELPSKTLPIDPYVLGVILGDGHISPTSTYISTSDQHVLDRITSAMPAYEFIHNGRYDYRLRMVNQKSHTNKKEKLIQCSGTAAFTRGGISGREILLSYKDKTQTIAAWATDTGIPRKNIYERISAWGWTVSEALGLDGRIKVKTMYSPLSVAIKELGLSGTRSHNKFVPENYKRGSVAQRLSLIQGLMDTDGSVGNGTHATFTSTSEQLAKDVQEIAWSLGAKAKIAGRQTHFTYKDMRKAGLPSWRVSIVMQDISVLFSLPRKLAQCTKKTMQHRLHISSVEAVGKKPAQCIAIDHPDHLYITDNYVVTHNTSFIKRLSQSIPLDERVITIEDTDEFGVLPQRNRVSSFYGSAGVTAEDAVQLCLRQRPDRVLMQELRGREAFSYLRILLAGFKGGSLTTLHAEEGVDAALLALSVMIKMHPDFDMPDDKLDALLRKLVDVVAWCAKDESGFSVPYVWFRDAAA